MMREHVLLLLLLGLALPASATNQVSVRELEQAAARSHSRPDARAAKQLSELQLTERLSTARLGRLKAELPGEQSQLALLGIADASGFLSLPAPDIPLLPPPDRAARDALLARSILYVKETIPRLPDFFATQETIHFADGPLKGSPTPGKKYDYRLHLVDKSTGTVHLVAGREELDTGQERNKPVAAGRELAVEGVFGPVFNVVLKDVLARTLAWSHWEPGPVGPMAVFRYAVTEGESHYVVQVPGDEGLPPSVSAYHGEIALDPASGAILRLTLLADREPANPVAKADILVEYGPIEIGGRSYTCPLRSVVLSLARGVDIMHDLYKFPQTAQLPHQLRLNDVEYRDYHLFRSDVRILGADLPGRGTNAPVTPP